MTQNSNAAQPSRRQDAQALVSAAITAHRTGNIALAEQLFDQALETDPKNADAMQLMGLIAKGKGDLKSAEAWMRKSLEANSEQAHVHYNLGNLLKARQALEDALACYAQAARIKPDYVEALVQQGELLMALERWPEAEKPLRKAFTTAPDNVGAVAAWADWHTYKGDNAGAERILRAALAKDPGNPFYSNNLGMLLSSQMRYEEALPFLTGLVNTMSERPEVFLNIANTFVGLGRFSEAVNHYLKAISLNPRSNFAHENVNNVLWQMGRQGDVGKSYEFARKAIPNDPDIHEMAAEGLMFFSRFDEAEADLEQASRLRPNTPGLYRLWTALRLGQMRPEEAMAIAKAGLRHLPEERDLLRKLTEAALLANQPAEAFDAACQIAALDPYDQHAAAYMATALRLMGRHDEAHQIYDYERFVHQVELPAPAGHADLGAYLQALAGALDQLHHARHEPIYQTLRNGTQTHESLFDRPGVDQTIVTLGEQVMAAAQRFIESLPDQPNHPFVGRKGSAMEWSGSWSVRLRGGGFHTDHIHPKGWISGVYYIDMPDCLADEEAKPGWIKFGEYSRPVGPALPWEKAVRPRPGLLVLFPSYMWHGTLPTSGDQQRLTVAFDIAPSKIPNR
jgi:uncharacterized protein (TIGR02466 family)